MSYGGRSSGEARACLVTPSETRSPGKPTDHFERKRDETSADIGSGQMEGAHAAKMVKLLDRRWVKPGDLVHILRIVLEQR